MTQIVNYIKLSKELKEALEGFNAPIFESMKSELTVELLKGVDKKKIDALFSHELEVKDFEVKELRHILKSVYSFIRKDVFNPVLAIKEDVKEEVLRSDMKKDDIPELYFNYDFKLKYADNGFAPATRKSILILFRKTAEMEKGLGKDLYDFNKKEMTALLKSLKYGTIKSLQDKVSTVEQYLNFAKRNGVARFEKNVAEEFSAKTTIETLLNEEVFENIIFSREEIFTIAMQSTNVQDGVIFALLFEGLSRKDEFQELIDLEENDIDFINNTIKIKGRNETIKVSKETTMLIKQALIDDVYLNVNGSRARKYKIEEGNRVLRGLRGRAIVTSKVLSQRIVRTSETFEYPTLNATNVTYSGQLYYAKQLIDKGADLDVVAEKVLKRFNLPVNESSIYQFKQRYERYVDSEK